MARYVTIATVNTRPVFCKDLPQDRSPVEFMVEHLRQDIAPVLCDHPDLIVLPELCDRILDATPEENLRFAREKKDRMMQFMQETARENRCYLVYPTHRFLPDGSVRNALYLLGRNGEIVGVYHKNFLMVSETERYGLICGKEMPVFECDFGRICPLICFDLNFEENALFITIDPPQKELPNEYFSVTGDNSLIAGMIDRIGGIELMWNSELLRFTGYQLTDMLEQSKEQQNLSLRILEEYIKKLGEIGITRQDLVYLIENSNTDLRVPDCFYWHNYIDKLCKNYKINY